MSAKPVREDLVLHDCPAPGCNVRIPSSASFCKTHWWLIPRIVRDAISFEYRKKARSEAHLAAIQMGIEALTPQRKPARETSRWIVS